MKWCSPLPLKLIPTHEPDSFRYIRAGSTGLPLVGHPGSFGFPRRYHVHEGVDLYAPEGMPITAVENGIVVAVMPFTGEHAGSPWWFETWAVMVEGRTGVVCYGEIAPLVSVGMEIIATEVLGTVKRVLRIDKGRPMSMLHLELYRHGVREPAEWLRGSPQPSSLRDPTEYLVMI